MELFRISILFLSLFYFPTLAQPGHDPVPPLQWIRVPFDDTAPSLAYAAAGYDPVNKHLVLFGGETQGGLLNSNTYLFDLENMNWTTPQPATNLNVKPPARSRAIFGQDEIASYRNGLLVYGGKGQDSVLDDIWEYAFSGQFWSPIPLSPSSPTPSGRYSAIGGGDPPSVANADSDLLTTFWLSGGLTGNISSPTEGGYEDVWRLQIEGTIAANFANPFATWSKLQPASNSASINTTISQASLLMRTTEGHAKLGLFGGCENTTEASIDCATQTSYTLNTVDSSPSWNSIGPCPAARLGASLVPNYNGLFSDQAFLFLGLSPNTDEAEVYQLGTRGEIDVLSISQGTWTRILPSCDPTSTPPCPIPREGAAVVSSAGTLVGPTSASTSDILVFGGRDQDGNVLSDLWILRATSARITFSNQTTWGSGFGDGSLGGGVDSLGQGVTVEFLDTCAPLDGASSTTSSQRPSPTGGSQDDPGLWEARYKYDTSAVHKSLAAVSVLAVLSAVLFARSRFGRRGKQYVVLGVAAVAWSLGVAGLAIAFSSIFELSDERVTKRSTESVGLATTPHAILGLVLFSLAYILTPLALLFRSRKRAPLLRHRKNEQEMKSFGHKATHSEGQTPQEMVSTANHKHTTSVSSVAPTASDGLLANQYPAYSPAQSHTQSQNHSFAENDDEDPVGAGRRVRLSDRTFAPTAFLKEQIWGVWKERRQRLPSHPSPPAVHTSSEVQQEEPQEGGGERGFVVLNRGRHVLERRAPSPSDRDRGEMRSRNEGVERPLSLSDVSWLERRRHLGMVGDLDYAMSQLQRQTHSARDPERTHSPSTHFSRASYHAPRSPAFNKAVAKFPPRSTILLRIGFQALLVALWIYTALAIFTKSGKFSTPLGVVFVLLVAGFYVGLVVLAIKGKPEGSVLVTVISRLRGTPSWSEHAHPRNTSPESKPLAAAVGDSPAVETSTLGGSRAFAHKEREITSGAGEEGEDEGEEIEREMGKREVSIVTVPKRRLFIANSGE